MARGMCVPQPTSVPCASSRATWTGPARSTYGNVPARSNLGVLCWQQGDVDRARRLLEEAHGKGDGGATFNLGVLCQQQGDVDRARRLYEEAHGKGHVQATFNLVVESSRSSRSSRST